MAHSMGNYLLEHYVLSSAYQAESRLFTNLVLSQADVDSVSHTNWVDKIVVGQRIYVTINEHDKVLGVAESVNPPRLGKNLANLNGKYALYFDFTAGRNVGSNHQLWGSIKNETVKKFFQLVLTGKRVDDISSYYFDARYNAYRIQEV